MHFILIRPKSNILRAENRNRYELFYSKFLNQIRIVSQNKVYLFHPASRFWSPVGLCFRMYFSEVRPFFVGEMYSHEFVEFLSLKNP